MYSKQLLIKMDADMLNSLKMMSEQLDLKLSTFARMVLKNYLNKKERQRLEDLEDIKVLNETRYDKGYDFDEFINELYGPDEFKAYQKGKKTTKKVKKRRSKIS